MTGAQPPAQPVTASADFHPEYSARHRAEWSDHLERVFASPVGQEIAARTLDLLTLQPGQSVLEVGCGTGVFLPLLAREVGPAGRVVGIGHSPDFVAEAWARVAAAGLAEVVTVEVGDAYHLPFPDDSFDAAHCERVLMHLEDPSAAIREMARVVRPGGWVVPVEPDHAGNRIDHPDREGFDILSRRRHANRQPDMGLTIYRRLFEAGLTERRLAPLHFVFTKPADFPGGLNFRRAAEAAVAEGLLTRERVEALLAYLDEASGDGRFFMQVAITLVAGRVPAPAAA